MKKNVMGCLAASLVVALSGCAGTNFVRPDDAALQNGKTTLAEVRSSYGKPFREGKIAKNDEDVTLLSFAYATTGGTPLEAGVTPARVLDLTFWNQKLVSNVFTSSFKEDASNFEAAKRSSIVKGKTTRGEVIQMLSKPSGYAIYPMIKDKDGEALVYSYNATRGSAFNLKFSKQVLTVTIDPKGVVSDVDYESSGTQ